MLMYRQRLINKIKSIKYKRVKCLGTVGALCIVMLARVLDIPCLFKSVFEFPCTACGMTRAWLSVFRLDFASAYSFNRMYWCIPILYLYIIFDGKLFKNQTVNNCLLVFIIGAMAVNYIFTNFN